jgi:RNA polymerase sigma-70 factor (ECF subfamily)
MTVTEPASPYRLADAFVAALPAGSAARAAPPASRARLDEILERAWSLARREWTDIDISADRFAAHLARVSGDASDTAEALAGLATGDLYLACAALGGDQRALATFEAHAFGEIDAAAAALRSSEVDMEEVKQIVRTQLFVADSGRSPGIAGYAGRGSLRGWVRVIATRELLRMRKRGRREIPLEEYLLNEIEGEADPELDRLKQLYRTQVADALRDAIERLDLRDRLLLRYQICDGMNIDALGAIYGVHRATAARWLSKARSSLVELTKERLAILLSVDPGETDSILRLVQSQLDVSLERRLRDDPERPPAPRQR